MIDPIKDNDIILPKIKQLENDVWSYDECKEIVFMNKNKYENFKHKDEILQIIKEKEVDIHNFKHWIVCGDWTYEQYLNEESDVNTSGCQFAYKTLTQAEFDLLKEVLL